MLAPTEKLCPGPGYWGRAEQVSWARRTRRKITLLFLFPGVSNILPPPSNSFSNKTGPADESRQ